ncbi:50S ribosomal protein L15 [Chlamydiales bacterium SCGC AB-751-O23]|jgi:large subunit ribosomal protein L15|nr:50S ribosomal protein L15 [Chlamydiales bacterium SCGC AB-751-O23]
MLELHNLEGSSNRTRKCKRLGRGPGSGLGKTSGRGQKGQGARSGYKRRYGKEGGQFPLYLKLPIRGFSRARFQKDNICSINFDQIDKMFENGEEVSLETLKEHGFINKHYEILKILANGELTKKLTIKAHRFSKNAEEKLAKAKITFEKVS